MEIPISSLVIILLIFSSMTIDIVVGQNTSSPSTNQTTTLKFVVPARDLNDFVKLKTMSDGDHNFSGFSIEVFRAAAELAIPSVPYVFVPYTNSDGTMKGSFDDMLQTVQNKEYDGAAGDISVLFYRMQSVDFTMPYLDSDTGLLVRVDTSRDRIGLTLAAKANLALVLVLAFGILVATLIVAKLKKPKTKLLMIVLVAMVILIIVASNMPPTPSTSLPTQRLVSDIKSLDDLKRTEAKVGYRQGAFVKNILISKAGLSESQLVQLNSEAEMLDKLQKGGQDGGIDALVAGIPSLKLFQAKYCDNVTIVPSFRIPSIGYAFAFPKDQSPSLVDRFSEAIVKLIDNGEISRIQATTLGDLDNVCEGNIRTISGSTLQDHLSLWLPIASVIFVVTLIICLLLVFSNRW